MTGRVPRIRRLVGLLRPLGATPAPGIVRRPFPAPRRLVLPGRGELEVCCAEGPPGAVPVLLLHGVTWTAALNYHHLVADLAQRHPVIAMDHRGHGGGITPAGRVTMADLADDALAVLDALGVERAIVVGFSLGTMTALHIADRHPERVAGLVLSGGCLTFAVRRHERALMAIGVPLLALGARTGLLRGLSARYLGASRSFPEVERAWPWIRAELDRSPMRAVVPAIRAAAVHDLWTRVDGLRSVPSAVVVPRHDILVPASRQRTMARVLGATVVEIDADHEAPISHPDLYRDAVLTALGSLVTEHEVHSDAG